MRTRQRRLGSKIKAKFRTFTAPSFVKIKSRVGEVSESKWNPIIGATSECYRLWACSFPMCCSVSESECVTGNWDRKSRPNFALFTRVNFGRLGEMSELYEFCLVANLWYTVYTNGAPLCCHGELESGCQKGHGQNIKALTYVGQT